MRLPVGMSTAFVLLWSFGYPLGALGVGAVTPMLLLAIRFAGSALIFGAITAAGRRRLPRGAQLGHVAVVGILTQVGQFGAMYLAMAHGVPAAIAALVIALNPVATALLARPILGEHIGVRTWVGIGIGVAAVLSACLPRVLHSSGGMGGAIALTLVGLLGVALGGVYQQRFCRDIDPFAGSAVHYVVALLPILGFCLLSPQHIDDPQRAAWVLPVMIVLSSVIGMNLFLRLVNLAGAAATSLLFTVIPSISALMSWAVLDQAPDRWIVLGLILGAISLLVSSHRLSRPRRCNDKTVGTTAPPCASVSATGPAPAPVRS